MKRFLWISAGLLTLLGLTVLSGYLVSLRQEIDLKGAQPILTPEDRVPLGGTLEYRLVVTLPMASPAPELRITPPENMVAGALPEARRTRWAWDKVEWSVTAPLRALRPGSATGGRADLSAGDAEMSFDIPDLLIEPVPAGGDKLDLAERMSEESSAGKRLWPVLGGAAVLLLAFLWWKFLHRKQKELSAPLSPWVRAEQALDRLDADVAARRVPLGAAFFRLTDVVRKYLEERYSLPFTVRTTDEFMQSLLSDSPLPEGDQPFLREFLSAADLVKFARAEPDETALSHAVKGARDLVRHTALQESMKEGDHV